MAGWKSEGWRKEIGVAIVPKRRRSAIEEEEEENKVVCRIPDIPFYSSAQGTHQTQVSCSSVRCEFSQLKSRICPF